MGGGFRRMLVSKWEKRTSRGSEIRQISKGKEKELDPNPSGDEKNRSDEWGRGPKDRWLFGTCRSVRSDGAKPEMDFSFSNKSSNDDDDDNDGEREPNENKTTGGKEK